MRQKHAYDKSKDKTYYKRAYHGRQEQVKKGRGVHMKLLERGAYLAVAVQVKKKRVQPDRYKRYQHDLGQQPQLEPPLYRIIYTRSSVFHFGAPSCLFGYRLTVKVKNSCP
jgi:hypothetical protein